MTFMENVEFRAGITLWRNTGKRQSCHWYKDAGFLAEGRASEGVRCTTIHVAAGRSTRYMK